MTEINLTRRSFLKGSLAAAIIGPLTAAVSGSAEEGSLSPSRGHGLGPAPPAVGQVNGMPYRYLGKTGAKVSLLGIGGYHIGSIASPGEAVALLRTALDEGVNFLDNAWEYHDGRSEERMGEALRDGYRAKAFLMTKVCARDAKGAMENLEDSLRRMKTDVIDLWQFHEVDFDDHPDMIFARNGAIHAAIKAREQGKIRFIGFTGHKAPRIHLKMLRMDFPWDAVQMPINVMDAHYRSFAREVVPVLADRNVGVIAMKTTASGAIVRSTRASAAECLRYAMSLPVSVVVSGMDNMEMMRQNIAVTKAFRPMSEAEIGDLLGRTRGAAGDGRLERFKTSADFDSEIHLGQR
jgi:predicted aldo/keto reductase-like oxidoreductase